MMISISSAPAARAGALGKARRQGSALANVGKTLSPLRSSLLLPSLRDGATGATTAKKRGGAAHLVPRAGGGGGGGGASSGTLSRGAGLSGSGGAGAGPQPIDEPPLTADSYVAVGLATCFERDDSGKLTERVVVEPMSASSLECMANGARTSFRFAAGTTLGALMRASASPGGAPSDALPEEYRGAALCANWARRVEAAARTWQRPHAQDHLMDIAPLPAKGAKPKARGGFNFSLDDKRVLNSVNVVTDADNVKQDISIDVYGRAEAEAAALEEEGALAAAGAALAGGEEGEGEGGDAHERAEAARLRATAPCDHMGPGGAAAAAEDSSDDEDELDALLAA